ncbi:SDR family oxidoreductase [Vibrio phage Va2]|nr:SDR family oxidoreductase [Vibrio phage Va2]
MKVLLTGHSSGVGYELLLKLLEAGHTVIGLSRSFVDSYLVKGYKGNLLQIKLDFTKTEEVSDFLSSDGVLTDIDVIINNAGITHRADITEHTTQQIVDIMNVNATVPMMLIGACMNYEKPQRYINVLSGSATETFRKLPVYGSAKAAMFKFSEQLVKDWDDLGVESHQVIDVLPGPIDTKLCPEHYKQNPVLTPEQVATCVMEYVESDNLSTHLVQHINA